MNDEQVQKIIEQFENHEKRISELEVCMQVLNQNSIKNVSKKEIIEEREIVLSIVNKIGDCEESEKIQTIVLDQITMEPKILLGFYISYKYFKNNWLTTGDIEKITSELGTKIAISNVSNKIKEGVRQFLESQTVRKNGQPTFYRLNRKGVKRFEEIIYGKDK